MPINNTRWNRIRYTLWAPIYHPITQPFQGMRKRSIELLELKAGDRVLLVGAGTGHDFEHLRRGTEIVATDLVPAMADKLRERAARLALPVDVRVMDGQRLDFPDATFDAVVLHLIVAVIPDPRACLREAARVLKPGGKIAIFDKFVADNKQPSLARRMLNLLTNLLASDITRRLGPLLEAADLKILHEEPPQLGGIVRIVQVGRKDPGKE